MNIKYETYFDKVYGAWYGKCLGGAGGAPVEGIKEIIKVEDFLEIINPLLPNDDLDLQLLWLEVLENNGEKLMATDLAKAWIEKCWYPFSEYGYFMKNYKRGISPPYSGRFNNSFFKEGMGCPIRSEIWGLIYPGQAEKAAYFAKMDGELDHTDNSVWAEMFLAGVESMMFEDSNIQRLILKGLKLIPKDTKLYNCINMCMDLYNKGKKDWKYARNLVVQKFGHPDFTNVVQNLGFIIIALLFGECDMRKTINIALKCGYDTDCTCATAGAIIGGIIGYKNIDSALLNSVQDSYVIGIDVKRRSCSIRDLAEDTCRVGVALLKDKSESILILDAPEYNFNWNKKEENLSILVDYTDVPAIGFNDICDIKITIKNNSDYDFSGILSIKNIPNGWTANINKLNINIKKNSEFVLENLEFSTDGVFKLLNTNIMQIEVSEKNGNDVYIRDFGIAGAVSYKAYGPFLEQMKKAPNPNHKSPHGEGCVLPTVECMVNNEVFLDKEYLNENDFDFSSEEFVIVNAYEDLIPLEEEFAIEGQVAFYLQNKIVVEEDTEVWAVIGNNDGFILWVNSEKIIEKDEIRYYTPYNNCELIKLKKGENIFTIKLLRRTGKLEFAMGLRKFEDEHWHKKQWLTEFSVKLD